jgi:branched-chain amino acid transport system ATP-binding protein
MTRTGLDSGAASHARSPTSHPGSPADAVTLAVNEVHTFYGNIHALKGVSLTVHAGEIVTLIGANGAGKTTTLKTISGLLRPRMGSVVFNGRRIDHLPPHVIVEMGLSQAPEGRRIFPRMTVLENLEMGAFARRDRAAVQEDLERVLTLFPRLKERLHQKGGTLSGGEQQMLAIGRALMARPRVLLLDEPSMGLAPVLVETIFQTIQDINRQGTTILLVEQNAHMALAVADRGYVLESGRIVAHAAAKELAASELVRKSYLGEE